jgi:hypothetical protein
VRSIRLLSAILTAAGLALLLIGVAFGLDPVWSLAGLLLLVAGVVKVIVVALWRNLGGEPTPGVRER